MFEIGTTLREARLRKGIEIDEAERATKVRAKYLRALETESFDILPGQTYVTPLSDVKRFLSQTSYPDLVADRAGLTEP